MNKILSLFLAANPLHTGQLNLDKEISTIRYKIQSSEYRDSIELVSNWAVRSGDLLQSLNAYKPQIVHFSGHGSREGEIILVDRNGEPKPVSAKVLKDLFTTLKDNIQVVILNACFSKIQAEAIIQVIDCAIGMAGEIDDDAAITFISSFYSAIGFGRSVQEAFEQGKLALKLENIPQEHIPVLLVKPGVDPSRILLASSASTRIAFEANLSLEFLKKQIIELNGRQVLRFQFKNNSDYMLKVISAHLVFMSDAPVTFVDINRKNKPQQNGTLRCILLFDHERDGQIVERESDIVDTDQTTNLNLTLKRHLKEDDIVKITTTRLGYIDFRCVFHQTMIHFYKDV